MEVSDRIEPSAEMSIVLHEVCVHIIARNIALLLGDPLVG